MGRDFSHVKRIVIKAGTNILSSKDGINMERVRSIVDQIAAAREKGYQVLAITDHDHYGDHRSLCPAQAATL